MISDAAAAQIATFLTVVVGFGIQLYREHRNHQWDIAERERLAATVRATAADVKATTANTAAELREVTIQTAAHLREVSATDRAANHAHTEQTAADLRDEIRAGASVAERAFSEAKAAYTEANNVNGKIEDLNLQLRTRRHEDRINPDGTIRRRATDPAVQTLRGDTGTD